MALAGFGYSQVYRHAGLARPERVLRELVGVEVVGRLSPPTQVLDQGRVCDNRCRFEDWHCHCVGGKSLLDQA
jgi:hypothetical protein